MSEKHKIYLTEEEQTEAINELCNKFKQSSNDTDLLLQIAIIKFNVPMTDYEGALNTIEVVLRIKKGSIKALLIKAIIEYYSYGEVSDYTYSQICQISKKNNKTHKNQINFLKALYYKTRDSNSYFEYLLKAIKEDPDSSFHYYLLSKFYSSKGKKADALKALNQAITNITKIYNANEDYDESDTDGFINEYVKGTEVSYVNYDRYLEMKRKLEPIET